MKLLAAAPTPPQIAQQIQQGIVQLQSLSASFQAFGDQSSVTAIQSVITGLQAAQSQVMAIQAAGPVTPAPSPTPAPAAATGLSPATAGGLGAIGGFLVGAVAGAAWKGKK